MTCREVIEFLDDYVSNNLAADQRQVFDAHLSVCPACVAYLQTYLKTVDLALAATLDAAPSDIPPELITAICAVLTKKN